MKCPHCGADINIGALLGSVSTPAKTRAARENAKLGGWPKGKPRKPKRVRRRANIGFTALQNNLQQALANLAAVRKEPC